MLGLIVSASLLSVIAVIGGLDVLATNLFTYPIPIVSEVSAESLSVIVFMAVAAAQLRGEHVEVDIVTRFLPRSIQRVLHRVVLLICTAFFVVLVWRSWALAVESWELKQTAMALINYPVYPFKIGLLIGVTVATLEFARHLVWNLLGRDMSAEQQAERSNSSF